MESLFHGVDDYLLGSLEAELCHPESSSLMWHTDPPQAEQLAMEVYDYLWIGTQLYFSGYVKAAFLQYRQAFGSIRNLISCRNITGVYHIAFIISDLLPMGQAELVAQLLRYVNQMSLLVLGSQDPHAAVWKSLQDIPVTEYAGLSAPLKAQRTSLMANMTVPRTPLGFCAKVWHTYAVLASHPDLSLEEHFPDVAETEKEFGPTSTQVMDLLYQQARIQYARGDHTGGETTCLLSIEKAELLEDWSHRGYLCHALRHMARAQHKRKKYSQARVNYIRALEVQRASLKDVSPALTRSKVFQIYEELNWISTHSDVADGDQQWWQSMCELEQEWEAELEAPV